MKYHRKLIKNPVEIQKKFQKNINGNQFQSSWNFNEIPVKISKKHKWKSSKNLNNLKFQWYTNGNPLDIQLKFQWNKNGIPLEIQLEFNSNINGIPVGSMCSKFNDKPMEILMKCQ